MHRAMSAFVIFVCRDEPNRRLQKLVELVVALWMLRKWPFDLFAVAMAVAIIIASLVPAPEIHAGHGSDKVLHLAAYGTLSFLAVLQRRSYESAAMVMAAVVFLSGAVELVQPFAGREREAADLLANTVGTLIGGFGVWLLHRFKRTGSN